MAIAPLFPDRIPWSDHVVLDIIQPRHAREYFNLLRAHWEYFTQYDPFSTTEQATVEQMHAWITETLTNNVLGTSLTHGIWFNGKLVGDFTVYLRPHKLNASIGYRIAPELQGRGIIAHTGLLVLQHLFDGLFYEQVWLKCHPNNERSIRTAKRLGLIFEEPLYTEETEEGDNVYDDFLKYIITAGQWYAAHR